ncbi:hypothetical protein [Xylanimonas sp. McL0601]
MSRTNRRGRLLVAETGEEVASWQTLGDMEDLEVDRAAPRAWRWT